MSSTSPSNYIRKWKVLVTAVEGSQSFSYDLSDLRCVFRVKDQCTSPMSECTLEVYNLNNKTANRLLKSGFNVQLFAGYQNSRYGKIFDGDIVQSFRNYHDGVDEILQILALSGNRMLTSNWVSKSMAGGQTRNQIVKTVAADRKITLKEAAEVQEKLDEARYPRGQVIFREVSDVLSDAADRANAVCQVSKSGVIEMRSLAASAASSVQGAAGKTLDLNYKNGLVGSPTYSEQGITITSLLDSRIRPLSLVKINNQYLERSYGSVNQLGIVEQDRRLVDPDGEYRIMSVVHAGDTHGDVWQTECLGVGRNRTIKDMAIVL